MATITISDLENAKTDVTTISEFMESASPTMVTRGGQTVPTRAGITTDLQNSAASWNNTIFASTAAGLAATSNGDYFSVPSTSSGEYLILYLNSAGSAVEQKRYPSAVAVDDIYHERLFAAQARYFNERRTLSRDPARSKAGVVIMLGQSNNTPGVNTPAISGIVSSKAFMPVGGGYISAFQFYAGNSEHPCNYADVGGAVSYMENNSEGPGSGIIAALDGVFPRLYACSVALGGSSLLKLGGAGPRCNLYAVVHKLCDHARAAGYEPVVMFTSVHGEANMSSFGLLSEENYYSYGMDYYHMCQMVAAQAMDQPDYVAPIVFHTPVSMQAAASSRGIVNAVVRIAKDITNGILAGGMYQWPVNTDLIHGSAVGFRERGEYDGWLLRKFFAEGVRYQGLILLDAMRAGATLTIAFNEEITRDTNFSFGTTLNATKQLGGVEYSYDGTNYVQITAMAVQGRKLVCTLASDPGVHVGTEEVRIAMQTSSSGVWPGACPGSQIRSNTEGGFLSVYDYTIRNYTFAAPQKLSVR